ncbi:MAG: hypothetical protein OXI11_07410 [Gammaproteobacteria bacterium]|nr:hypothetical protein [Gammaproteobacteria bacterium]MXW44510.1 hypothetical protein [Gammaproteobacteria bacterium]MYD01351.1 hypothetical protein [Gammaproteobacteria bacterium]MYI24671.1 hypothetical protein [Gammaproteobacteria bacterium]
MKKVIAVAAVIGLAVGLTWAAEQVGGWLGFTQQDGTVEDTASDNTSAPGNEAIPPGGEGVPPSIEASADSPAQGEDGSPAQPELSTEVTSIEEDLARIEEALGSDEVLEEFTPSEPLSADNPVVWPTDI